MNNELCLSCENGLKIKVKNIERKKYEDRSKKSKKKRFKNCINHNPFIYFNKSRFPIILWNFEGKNKT